MHNRYPARCCRCGQVVPVGNGTIELRNGRWITTHDGLCPKAEIPARTRVSYGTGGWGYDREEYADCSEADWQDMCNPNEGSKG